LKLYSVLFHARAGMSALIYVGEGSSRTCREKDPDLLCSYKRKKEVEMSGIDAILGIDVVLGIAGFFAFIVWIIFRLLRNRLE
jgi:hypothetical protein